MDAAHIAAQAWWTALQTRYEHDDVKFLAGAIDDTPLPQDLFDSVADNLLTNALRKRQREPGIRRGSEITLHPLVSLTVIDSGAPAPEHVARNLFLSPVASDFGLGGGAVSGRAAGGAGGVSAGAAQQSAGAGAASGCRLRTAVIRAVSGP
jgi:hypothetical protein